MTSLTERTRESYFRGLCENIGIALITTDLDRKICFWNASASRMFGAAAEQMVGVDVRSVIPRAWRKPAERAFEQAVSQGETAELIFAHRRADGSGRELAATIAPLTAPSGERFGVCISLRDISKRIALEKELHDKRKMASLGEMAGAVAHHFNNILGGMVTSIDYVGSCTDPAIQRRLLSKINLALTRATSLVNGLVAFSDGDSQVVDLSDFTELVNQIADDVDREVEGGNIRFSLNMPALPVVPVPRSPALTILRNVVRNALEAMPDGGSLNIDVSMGNGVPVLRVTDTGMGLDDETKARMFEPFWTTKGVLAAGSGQATGLGLSVAHGLARRIGWTISVVSEPDKGCCITIRLPKEGPA